MHFDALFTLFFRLKNGHFLDFGFFSAKIAKNQNRAFFKRLKKVQLFISSAWNFFFEKFWHFRLFLHTFWGSNSENSWSYARAKMIKIWRNRHSWAIYYPLSTACYSSFSRVTWPKRLLTFGKIFICWHVFYTVLSSRHHRANRFAR